MGLLRWVCQKSMSGLSSTVSVTYVNLATFKAGAKDELLFNKPAPEKSSSFAPACCVT